MRKYLQDNITTQDKHGKDNILNTVLYDTPNFINHLFRYTERNNTLEGNKQTSDIIRHAALLE